MTSGDTEGAFYQKFSFRVPAVIVGACFIASLAVGIVSYQDAKESLAKATDDQLVAVMESRKDKLEKYLDAIEQDLASQSHNPVIFDALDEFIEGWERIPGDPTETLQQLYITDNPNPTGQKEELDFADDGSLYSRAHAKYHPYMRTFLRERGYYDIFLFDTEGNLVYSVYKELDYATNLNTGEWKDSDLGNVFRATMENPESGKFSYFDFRPYAPSADAPASFIGTPLITEDGELKGSLVFQMPVEELNAVMTSATGLGETGRAYIVGLDQLMRSQDRFTDENTILARKIDNPFVAAALGGETGITDAVDENGQLRRLAYTFFDFETTRWAFMADKSYEQINAPIFELRNGVIVASAITFIVMAVGGIFFGRTLSVPINRLSGSMQQLAGGDRAVDIPEANRKDEIGDMSRTVQVFKDSIIANDKLQAEQREAEKRTMEEENRRAEEKRTAEAKADEERRAAEARAEQDRRAAEEKAERDRKQAMIQMADGFEASVMGVVEALSQATSQMKSAAETMSAASSGASEQATAVAAASEEASSNVQTVAASAEELSASVGEISRQVMHSNEIAQTAVTEAQQTNNKVEGLAEAAQKIGDVVSLINDIAAQTNLLALNATIEAARAGDAGKGFAVVASEVKSLATQTSRATEEIGAQISSIQSATGEAVQAIQVIGTTIGEMGEIATSISSAVDEQGSATREIAGSVQQAAAGTREVSTKIVDVSQATTETQASSSQILSTAQELAQQGEILRAEVNKFLDTVRAG